MRRDWIAAAALSVAFGSWAQSAPDFLPGTMGKPTGGDSAWSEVEVPPPPALRTEGLVPVDIGTSSLRWGVDPASVAVGTDKVVRYVIVATSASGAVNAMYEGILCDRDEYRVYARYSPGSGWHAVSTGWKSVKDGVEAVHVRAVARQGVCLGHAPSGTASDIVNNLRSPQDRKFGSSSAP